MAERGLIEIYSVCVCVCFSATCSVHWIYYCILCVVDGWAINSVLDTALQGIYIDIERMKHDFCISVFRVISTIGQINHTKYYPKAYIVQLIL